MCGRASLTKTESELEVLFKIPFYHDGIKRYNSLPSFNIAPSQYHPIITVENPTQFTYSKWGIKSPWNPKILLINSRIENLSNNEFYKNSLSKQRCLIPFDSYYEWKNVNGIKIPYRIVKSDYSIFFLAGIYYTFISQNGERSIYFSIITQEASGKIQKIHSRMPAFIENNKMDIWLSNITSISKIISHIKLPDEKEINFYRISNRVNNVKFNDKSIIEKYKSDYDGIQGKLF